MCCVCVYVDKAMHRCDDIFHEKCWWRNKFIDCCDIFSVQLSEYGICYSFNSVTNPTGVNRMVRYDCDSRYNR